MSDPVHPVRALQTALRTHLLARPSITTILGQAVYETPAHNTKPPFIAFGDIIIRDAGATDREAVTIELDLVAHAAERNLHSALDIIREAGIALKQPLPALDDHHLVSLEARQGDVRHDSTRNLTRASLRLRAFLEPL